MTAHVATSRDETVGAYGKRSDGNLPSRSLVRKPDAEDLWVPMHAPDAFDQRVPIAHCANNNVEDRDPQRGKWLQTDGRPSRSPRFVGNPPRGVDRTGQVQSLLYVAFVKILRLLRLGRRDNEELAIKVVMLRHEVAVLRRQVARPVLQPSGRALFAGLSRLLDRGRWERFFVQPETLLRWHRDLVRRRAGLGPMSTGLVGPHHLMFRSIGWKAPRWSDTAKRCLSVGQVFVTHARALLFGATDVQSALSSLIRDLDASRSDSRSGIHWCCHSPEDRRYVETDRSSPDQ